MYRFEVKERTLYFGDVLLLSNPICVFNSECSQIEHACLKYYRFMQNEHELLKNYEHVMIILMKYTFTID